MNRRLVTAAAVCAVLTAFLAGCATTPTPAVPDAPAPTSAPAVTHSDDTVSTDTAFNSAVSSHGIPSASFAAARTIAHSFCSSLDTGETFDAAAVRYLGMAQDDGVTPEQIGAIVGAGVTAYCPSYQGELDAFIASH